MSVSHFALPRNIHGHPAVTFSDVAQELTRPSMDRLWPGASKYDLIIIGGGYTGLSAALHAKQAMPDWRVLLLEARQIGSGASGKSAGHVNDRFEAQESDIFRQHGRELGEKLLRAAQAGPDLVRSIIKQHKLDCDVRDGYVFIEPNGNQRIVHGKDFGIDPYPYVLGMAAAARQQGVKIVEHARVTGLTESPWGQVLEVNGHAKPLQARYVIAAGGHAMGRDIPLLRQETLGRTVELNITTVKSEPLPLAAANHFYPEVGRERLPGADTKLDMEYWSLDRAGRLIFGSRSSTNGQNQDKLERAITADLHKRFPDIVPDFRRAHGRDPQVTPLVQSEPISFTRDLMPNVGSTGTAGKILYVNGLGGHGIALGTLLGKESVNKIRALETGNPTIGAVFDQFAAMHHAWTPVQEPLRRMASRAGVAYVKAMDWLMSKRPTR